MYIPIDLKSHPTTRDKELFSMLKLQGDLRRKVLSDADKRRLDKLCRKGTLIYKEKVGKDVAYLVGEPSTDFDRELVKLWS